MNIKKYCAPDMRRAINLVRKEHGPDAVILSSESVDGGVEIIAAIDYDPALITSVLGIVERSDERPLPVAGPDASDVSADDAQVAVETASVASQDEPERTAARESSLAAATEPGQRAEPGAAPAGSVAPMATRTGAAELEDLLPAKELRAIQKDLYALKGLVRERIAWSDLRAITPQRSWLMRRAEAFGLTAELADKLVSEVEHPELEDRAWREVIFGLARRLTVLRQDPIEQGGIFALVGPTGVGKTTTIAKLAARHCLRHGRDSLGLITTDSFRIGAHRQLDAFGAILGVPVRTAASQEALAGLLNEMSSRKLILIDTSGVAPRDVEMTGSLAHLDASKAIRRFLVLAANMQATVMQDAVRGFGGDRLSGAVITKIDETNALGAAISVLINSRLPAVWLSDGQRVPEDLALARVANLLKRATVMPETEAESTVPAFVTAVPGAVKRSETHAAV